MAELATHTVPVERLQGFVAAIFHAAGRAEEEAADIAAMAALIPVVSSRGDVPLSVAIGQAGATQKLVLNLTIT
jgi:LDH2 family malate/lactate/ureidoglycolate dehydrogenase